MQERMVRSICGVRETDPGGRPLRLGVEEDGVLRRGFAEGALGAAPVASAGCDWEDGSSLAMRPSDRNRDGRSIADQKGRLAGVAEGAQPIGCRLSGRA